MKAMGAMAWKVLVTGGWVPLLVFAVHVVCARLFLLYETWPDLDTPMHFAGGAAIAFFVSRSFQALPRGVVSRSRRVVLELLLIGSLTASATVFWEFAEFACDRVFGTHQQ